MTTSEKSISLHYPDSLDPAVVKRLGEAIQSALAPSALAATVEFVPESDVRFDESKIAWKVDPKTKQNVAVVTPQSVKEWAAGQGQSSHALSQIMNRLYREASSGNRHLQGYFLWDDPVRTTSGESHPQVLGMRAATAGELMRNYGDYVGLIAGIGKRGAAAFTDFCETLIVPEPSPETN